MSEAEQVVTNPTYMGDIRLFFEQIDIEHMATMNIDLGSYAGVKKNALAVYAHTTQPGGDMPPEADRKWSAERSQTFKNWILTAYPVGAATPVTADVLAAIVPAGRVRKNIASLTPAEIDQLKVAFAGVMAKDASDATSYSAIAGIHGLPQSWCLHHEDRFNPWHRVYLKVFEDALRAIPGCQDVTLPYWDISTPVPDVLKQPPFDSYVVATLPPPFGANYKTVRYDQPKIDANLTQFQVLAFLASGMTQTLWGVSGVSGLQDDFIAAHDGGHLSIGPTMADQDVASYDPIFWFYHCDLDRAWAQWQIKVGATTLTTFTTTLAGNTSWLSVPFNALPPFTTTADETIDFDVSYEEPPMALAAMAFVNRVGSIDAAREFTIPHAKQVSVMIKDIDRLGIPGSFVVKLIADGEPVAKRAFFQPTSPRDCANCRKHGLISVNFRVDADKVTGRRLSVELEVPGQDHIGKRFPMSAVGNPTINARLLLEDGGLP